MICGKSTFPMKNAVANHTARESPSSVHLQALSNAFAPPGRRIVSKRDDFELFSSHALQSNMALTCIDAQRLA